MAARARIVQPPSGGLIHTGDQNKGYRLIAGSMGTGAPEAPPLGVAGIPDVPDDTYAQEIARREAADPEVQEREAARPQAHAPEAAPLRVISYATAAAPRDQTDLSPLPDKFAFEVERKPDGWWVVRAPGVHVGLFVAHQDLGTALTDAPIALAEIVRLDGCVPRGKRGRKVG